MPIEIFPGLWIGSKKSSVNKKFINKKKIICIINVSKEIENSSDIDIEKVRIPIKKPEIQNMTKDNVDIYDYYNDTTEFMHKKIQGYNNIFIHSDKSKDRASAMLAAYIIRYGKVTPDQAIYYIKTKFPKAFGNKVFYYFSLRKYYDYLNNS